MGMGIGGVRNVLRTLVRQPGYTLLALLTVSLGVGSATAVFSMANWLLIRPIPGVTEMEGLFTANLAHVEQAGRRTGVSLSTVQALASTLDGQADFAAFQFVTADLEVAGQYPVKISGNAISEGYFGTLGVRAAQGRLFVADEFSDPSAADRIVISEVFSRDRLGGREDPVGTTVVLSDQIFQIIGIVDEFRGAHRVDQVDFWVLPRGYARIGGQDEEAIVSDAGRRFFFNFVGRRTGDTQLALLDDQMSGVLRRAAEESPESAGVLESYRMSSFGSAGVDRYTYERSTKTIRVLAAGAALLLLLACANLSNLLLVQAQRKSHEAAVRRSLGASRRRVVANRLSEALALGLVGGAIGVLAADGVLGTLQSVELWSLPPLGSPELDVRVTGFGVLLSVVSAALFGLLPALWSGRGDVASAMTGAGRTLSRPGQRVRSFLTSAQVGVGFVLVFVALLLTRSVDQLRSVPTGFESDGVSWFTIQPRVGVWTPDMILDLSREMRLQLDADPRVVSAAIATARPLGWGRLTSGYMPEDGSDQPSPMSVSFVTRGYFETLEIDLIAGRTFEPAEERLAPGSPAERVVLNRAFALELFGSTDVVGRTVHLAGRGGFTPRTIIGVVEDERVESMRGEIGPVAYAPQATTYSPTFNILLRSDLPLNELRPLVEEQLSLAAPGISLFEFGTLQQSIADDIGEDRLVAGLLGAIGAMALIIALVGLYGTLHLTVADRSKEFGIRVALGARPSEIARRVYHRTSWILFVGLGAGAVVILPIRRLLEPRLFGVTLDGISTWAMPCLVFVVAGVIASWAPIRKAVAADPVGSLLGR
jgi:predicted permease